VVPTGEDVTVEVASDIKTKVLITQMAIPSGALQTTNPSTFIRFSPAPLSEVRTALNPVTGKRVVSD
jgi:hypothetical protein